MSPQSLARIAGMPAPATDTAAAALATETPLAPRHHQGRLAPAALLGQPRPA